MKGRYNRNPNTNYGIFGSEYMTDMFKDKLRIILTTTLDQKKAHVNFAKAMKLKIKLILFVDVIF